MLHYFVSLNPSKSQPLSQLLMNSLGHSVPTKKKYWKIKSLLLQDQKEIMSPFLNCMGYDKHFFDIHRCSNHSSRKFTTIIGNEMFFLNQHYTNTYVASICLQAELHSKIKKTQNKR